MIQINQLSFGYKKQPALFKDMNLSIKTGGICGLLGMNGAGKTSLLKLLAGLVFPKKGQCRVLDCTPMEREPSFLSDIYYLSEELYLPDLKIETYLQLYTTFYPKFNVDMFNRCLKEFDISSDKLLTSFSYGQKKKFLLSFGFATNCHVLLLDEPTNGLDIPSRTQFRKLLASIASENRLIIISTHQVHDIENLVDSIIIVHEGKIVFNQALFEVSKHLTFAHQMTEPNTNECLYSEKTTAGYNTLSINDTEREGAIDLEILFNAVISRKNTLQTIFEEGK